MKVGGITDKFIYFVIDQKKIGNLWLNLFIYVYNSLNGSFLFSNFIDGLVDLVPYGIDKIPYSMEKVPYSVDQIINCSSEQFIILMKRSTLTNNQETI